MAELALIIGNGFDIDMGLPSKYSDFADSPKFHDLTRRMRDMYFQEERGKSLVLQLLWAQKCLSEHEKTFLTEYRPHHGEFL